MSSISIYSLYHSNQKTPNTHGQSIYSAKKLMGSHSSKDLFYSQLAMQKSLKENLQALRKSRQNSPTFRKTDTIAQTNMEPPAFRSSIKKALFSDIDNIQNPERRLHTTNIFINDKMLMYRGTHRSKQKGECSHLGEVSKSSPWKPGIKIDLKAHQRRGLQVSPRAIRKSVMEVQPHNPILNPRSPETRKLRKSVQENTVPLVQSSPGKKTFEQANSSKGFRTAQSETPPTKLVTKAQENPYGLQAKNLLAYRYGPKFRDEVANIKQRKKLSEKCTTYRANSKDYARKDIKNHLRQRPKV